MSTDKTIIDFYYEGGALFIRVPTARARVVRERLRIALMTSLTTLMIRSAVKRGKTLFPYVSTDDRVRQ